MNLAGRTIGAIVARTRPDFVVSPRNLELAFALTQQATLAVHLSDLATLSELAAVAREQEKAAGEKIAELAKANRVLQRTAAKLTASAEPELFLSTFLAEAMDLAGAAAGAVFRRVGETELTFATMIQDGVHIPLHDIEALPCAAEKRQVSREDRTGYFARLMLGEVLHYCMDDPGDCCPPIALQYHREHAHRCLWEFPFSIDEKVAGTIALAFRTTEAPGELLIQTLTALTSQLAIALKLTRLNEEGQRAALALEREQTLAEERSRIAREIHDTLAQSFTGILMQLQAANEYSLMNPDVAAEEMARDGLVQARTSVMSLSPKEPHLDLAEGIRSTVERALTDTGTRSEVIIIGQIKPLDAIVSANVLRICQEALNNAQRYSGASLITVTLRFDALSFSLTVADDGAGFEVDAAESLGFGLNNMKTRAKRIGGELFIKSQVGSGTEIELRVLLQPTRASV
jgi:signal transduction histidine kinase